MVLVLGYYGKHRTTKFGYQLVDSIIIPHKRDYRDKMRWIGHC